MSSASQEASSKCPVCGINTPHSHTRKELALIFREHKLRILFEENIDRWWNELKCFGHGSYGMQPLLTLRLSHKFPHIKAGSYQDKYMWEPVQLLWEAFKFVPLVFHPPLPDEGIPDINEALEIKSNPFSCPPEIGKFNELINSLEHACKWAWKDSDGNCGISKETIETLIARFRNK